MGVNIADPISQAPPWRRLVFVLVASTVAGGFFELAAFVGTDSDPEANSHLSVAGWIAIGIPLLAGVAAHLLFRRAGRSHPRAAAWGAVMAVVALLAPIALLLLLVLASAVL